MAKKKIKPVTVEQAALVFAQTIEALLKELGRKPSDFAVAVTTANPDSGPGAIDWLAEYNQEW